jgi:regulator of protease activity HflC (stomatin/prohibitin superfamily)
MDDATDKWGEKVNRVELKDITPPSDFQNSRVDPELRKFVTEQHARLEDLENQICQIRADIAALRK